MKKLRGYEAEIISFNYREQIFAASSTRGDASDSSIENIIGGVVDVVLDCVGASFYA